MRTCELLAPAGGWEALKAAVRTGADAVYLGGADFNARQSAQNFSREQLLMAIDYCHLRQVKVYAAVNTLIADREFSGLADYLAFLNESGVDGIIVQDFGVAALAKQVVPQLPLHGSTQMTVYDVNGALFLERLGFKRVVLARELGREQIRGICSKTNIEIEVFIHGAICVCYSGQCLMSSMIGGRSGNRGSCAQPCRLPYALNGKTGNLLSPKDMCLLPYIQELADMGVCSLKIEGRMKGPDYVGTVVGVYRKYLDSGAGKVAAQDYDALNRIFYRGGLTDGYFTGRLGKDMFCHSKPENPYLKQRKAATYPDMEKKRGISLFCELKLGQPATCFAQCGDLSVQVAGDVPAERAIRKSLSPERAEQQLAKLGDSVFTLDTCQVRMDEGITIPISELNNLRRKLVAQMERAIADSFRRESCAAASIGLIGRAVQPFELAVQVSNRQQLSMLRQLGCRHIYLPLELAQEEGEAVVLPKISPTDLAERLAGIQGKKIYANNIGQLQLLKELGREAYGDYGLNVFNSFAIAWLSEFGVKEITLSPELTLAQIRSLQNALSVESIIYGRLPLMTTENCMIKSSGTCSKGGYLTDRMGQRFPVRCLEGCRNEILNAKPIVMSDKLRELTKSGLSRGRLLFTTETPEQCRAVYLAYKQGAPLNVDFTRGKFYKGV